MSGHTRLVEDLRESGHRLTPQRDMILDVIHQAKGHLSAEEICYRVQERYPYMNISTVYRTLELLRELHLVSETNLGEGRIKYELLPDNRHHHLICQQCGQMAELEHRFLKPLQEALQQEYGFCADIDHFAIFGTCQRCQEQQRKLET